MVGSDSVHPSVVQRRRSQDHHGRIPHAVGADINGEGIEPNVEAPDDPETEDVDETLEKALQVIADRS